MNKTILVVDDDTSVRESVTKVFGHAGYEAVLAAGGLEAVAQFDSNEIDLVLLDIGLPNLGLPNQSGWKTSQHPAREYAEDPIFFITGQAGQFQQSLAASTRGLMQKPLEAHRPLHRIQLLLTKSKEPAPFRSNAMPYPIAA